MKKGILSMVLVLLVFGGVIGGCGSEGDGDCVCPNGKTVATDEDGCCYDDCYNEVEEEETGAIVFEIIWETE